jgi:hypothetical protein
MARRLAEVQRIKTAMSAASAGGGAGGGEGGAGETAGSPGAAAGRRSAGGILRTGRERSESPSGRAIRWGEEESLHGGGGGDGPPPPPLRTNWTRLVPPSVLTGHVSSLLPY